MNTHSLRIKSVNLNLSEAETIKKRGATLALQTDIQQNKGEHLLCFKPREKSDVGRAAKLMTGGKLASTLYNSQVKIMRSRGETSLLAAR